MTQTFFTKTVRIPEPWLRILDALLFVFYLAVTAFVTLRHEPWADEIQPWLLARDMDFPSLMWMIFNNYDRHPGVWYLVLFPFARAGLPVISMAVLNWLFAVTASAVFFFRAPFSRIVRYAFIFGYFMFYEYPVIARHYALTILLIFLIAWIYEKRHEKPILYGALILLLFNTSYLALGLASALSFVFLLEVWKKGGHREFFGLGVMIVGGILVLITMGFLPEEHSDHGIRMVPIYDNFIHSISKGYIPFREDISSALARPVSVGIVLVLLLSLRRKAAPLFILIMSFLTNLYIFVFRFNAQPRHYGFFLILTLFALWIEHSHREGGGWKPLERILKKVSVQGCRTVLRVSLTLCLLVSVKNAITLQYAEIFYPFSGAKEMASLMRQGFDRLGLDITTYPIVAHRRATAVSLLGHLPGTRFWFPESEEYGTYFLNTKKVYTQTDLTEEEVMARAFRYFNGMDGILVLLTKPLPSHYTFRNYRLRPLFAVYEGVFGSTFEIFFIYKPERIA